MYDKFVVHPSWFGMRANPGGQLAPEDVVGRDGIVNNIWRALENQSVLITAERRVGKTSIIVKMRAEKRPSVLTFYQDVEKAHSAHEFADAVFSVVRDHLSTKEKTLRKLGEFMKAAAGTEIAGLVTLPDTVKSHWKEILERVVQDLVDHQEGLVVFFWDELPQMIANISKHDPSQAIQVLDVLRGIRQEHSASIRMVYTGSIGLHCVLRKLRKHGYSNAPKNDLYTQGVPPLKHTDAVLLAEDLLRGEKVVASEPERLADEIAIVTSGIPFYIQHIVRKMQEAGLPVAPGDGQRVLDEFLLDAKDPWDLRHYRTRLDQYYEPDEVPIALGMLDVLAASERPLSFAEVMNELGGDREKAREVLRGLQEDHYVIRTKGSSYTFAVPFIRDWWRIERDIVS